MQRSVDSESNFNWFLSLVLLVFLCGNLGLLVFFLLFFYSRSSSYYLKKVVYKYDGKLVISFSKGECREDITTLPANVKRWGIPVNFWVQTLLPCLVTKNKLKLLLKISKILLI